MQVLRHTLNCSLPIEIIYNGPSEMDDWSVKKFQVPVALTTPAKPPLQACLTPCSCQSTVILQLPLIKLLLQCRGRCYNGWVVTMTCDSDLLLMQTSFKDVRCINAGAIPFPKHGRQIEVDPSELLDEEVILQSHTPQRFTPTSLTKSVHVRAWEPDMAYKRHRPVGGMTWEALPCRRA